MPPKPEGAPLPPPPPGEVLHLYRWVPVALALATMGWVYVVYGGWFLLPLLPSHPWRAAWAAAGFHLLFALMVWAYVGCIAVHPGRVPEEWGMDRYPEGDPAAEGLRPCAVCRVYKPPRAHHCSTCKECILMFDHHCPWINNCVGLRNRKHFLLFLLYTPLTCLWVCLTSIDRLNIFGPDGSQDGTFLFMYLVVAVLGGALVLFFSGSLTLAVRDQTTVEALTAGQSPSPGAWRHSLGAIFGSRPALWLLPTIPRGPQQERADGAESLV